MAVLRLHLMGTTIRTRQWSEQLGTPKGHQRRPNTVQQKVQKGDIVVVHVRSRVGNSTNFNNPFAIARSNTGLSGA